MRLFHFRSYDSDLAGRVTREFVAPVPRDPPEFDAAYDADNRLQTWNSDAVVHDPDGNMTLGPAPGGGDFVNYHYDARNRLTAVGDVSYQYDPQGNRIARSDPGGTTRYLVDPHGDALPRVLVREQPDGTLTRYVYGIGLLYEVDQSDQATAYHFDQVGATVALTDTAGTVTDRVEYTPFGTVTHREGHTDTPFLFNGAYGVMTDPNGLLHMRARYYNPTLRRFVNADPIGFDGGLNWYAYANNNPVSLIDPMGLKTLNEWLWGPGGGNIGAGVRAVREEVESGTSLIEPIDIELFSATVSRQQKLMGTAVTVVAAAEVAAVTSPLWGPYALSAMKSTVHLARARGPQLAREVFTRPEKEFVIARNLVGGALNYAADKGFGPDPAPVPVPMPGPILTGKAFGFAEGMLPFASHATENWLGSNK